MIDHLIVLPEAPDLTPYEAEWRGPNPVIITIAGHRVDVLPVQIIRAEAVPGATEDDPGTPAETAPGFWFCARAAERIDADLPWPCVTITDDQRASRGEKFILAIGEGWTWSQLTGRVAPLWAGTGYPFGPEPHLLVT